MDGEILMAFNLLTHMKHKIIAVISLIAFAAATSQGAADNLKSHVEIYVTAKDTGQRMAKTDLEFTNSLPVGENGPPVAENILTVVSNSLSAVVKQQYIFVDPSKKFQTVIGIGGALTDASAETFY